MNKAIPLFLQTTEDRVKQAPDKKKRVLPFIDRTLKNVAGFVKTGYVQSDCASANGFMQQINPLAKVIFLTFFIITINIIGNVTAQLSVSLFLMVLFTLSKLHIFQVYKKILLLGFYFGFLVIVPASLNIITNGEIIYQIISFDNAHKFWIYNLPMHIGITQEGLWVVLRFFLRVVNSISLTMLVMYTTPFNQVIKSLKLFKVPGLFLMVITLTYKFIFILSHTTEETYLALKSRWWRNTTKTEADNIVAGRIVYIFRKSWVRYEEIFMAMTARGFSGRVTMWPSEKLNVKDILFICFIMLTIIAVISLNYKLLIFRYL